MKQLIAALVLIMGFAGHAHADLLLEPYLGYETGKAEQGSSKEDMSGVGYGARIGYQKMGFMVGADLHSGQWDYDSSPSQDVTPRDLGVFVGFNFPVLIRVYGVYNFDADLKFKSAASTTKYEGTGVKLGVGFTALPFVSINLEYSTSTYDEADGNALTNDLKTHMYGLNVSLPLTF